MTISIRMLMDKLKILANFLNKEIGTKDGQWFLDLNGIYGGYIIIEMMEKGGEHHPLLNKRVSANVLSDALDLAIAAMRLKEVK